MGSKRTLCGRCVKDYRTAGFLTIPCGYQRINYSCDICGRQGFVYTVKRDVGERNRLNAQS